MEQTRRNINIGGSPTQFANSICKVGAIFGFFSKYLSMIARKENSKENDSLKSHTQLTYSPHESKRLPSVLRKIRITFV